jgi:polysaccharide export outer membrane protein
MPSSGLRLGRLAIPAGGVVVAQARRARLGSRTQRVARALVTIGLVGSLTLSPTAQQADYVLGSQDVLSITVWGQGGLSDRFTVEADGTFTFPMLGRVRAGELTVRQLQSELTRRLADDYFKDPQVTVVVEAYHSQHIFVVGEVKSPGTYALTGQMTLIEALALAGSTTINAGSLALVRRRTAGEASVGPLTRNADDTKEIRVDLTELQDGVFSNNPILHDGDTIVVPRAAPVHVFGQVGRPGDYAVGRGTTVRQVLSLAGGVSQRGATGRIKIVRVVDGNEREIKVELDDRVNPGDMIVVPERFF